MKFNIKGTQQNSAKYTKVKSITDLPGADRIKLATVDFQEVVVSKDMREGDKVIFFPSGVSINKDLLSYLNCFRDKTLNADKEVSGFFESNGKVKALNLMKGTVRSCGFILESYKLEEFLGINFKDSQLESYFDTIKDITICEKFIPVNKNLQGSSRGNQKLPSRLIEGQVNLHVNTNNLRQRIYSIKPNSNISVTYKTHGASGWASNIKVKRTLTFVEKILLKLGVNIDAEEYDLIFGSRRIIKNGPYKEYINYSNLETKDLWAKIVNQYDLKNKIPKGYTLYYEILNVQKNYDYKCKPGENIIEVYRITATNPDGIVTELSFPQIKQFCKSINLPVCHEYYSGRAGEMYKDIQYENEFEWAEKFLERLQEDYNEKDCFMCENKVPEEGIILREEDLFSCKSYKLKSKRFLIGESKESDSGEANIEDVN